MEFEPENSQGMISFHVEWIAELNEVALHAKHFSQGDAGVAETCLLIPRALAIELRWALDRALKFTPPA